jgi:hypothetical protein
LTAAEGKAKLAAMLSSVLPGLRELRAPLAAGYLWLLTGWLIFGDEVPKRREATSGALRRLYELQPVVSAVGLAVVASVAAYIVGSIAIEGLNSLVRRRLNARRRSPEDLFAVSAEGRKAMRDWVNRRISIRARHRAAPWDLALAYLSRDRDLLMTRLLAESVALHTEVDRPDAEATFRIGLAPPLTVLVVYLAVTVSPWWLLGLLISALLLWQSALFARQANDALVIAVLSREELNEPLLRELRMWCAEMSGTDAARARAALDDPGWHTAKPLRISVELDTDHDDYAHRVVVEFARDRSYRGADGRRQDVAPGPPGRFEVHLDSEFEVTKVIAPDEPVVPADAEATQPVAPPVTREDGPPAS